MFLKHMVLLNKISVLWKIFSGNVFLKNSITDTTKEVKVNTEITKKYVFMLVSAILKKIMGSELSLKTLRPQDVYYTIWGQKRDTI